MPFHPTLRKRLAQHFTFRKDERDARCLATYPLFLRFFKERIAAKDLQLSDAKIGVVLIYTWMPSADLNPDCWRHFRLAKRMLQRDKSGRLTAAEIDSLKSFVGGSLIATSKFLHLLNPSRYAMWDTNVARAAYRYTWQQCNRSDRYIEYLDDLKGLNLASTPRERVRGAIGSAGALRVKEFALFQLGIAESTRRSDASTSIEDFPFAKEELNTDLGEENRRF